LDTEVAVSIPSVLDPKVFKAYDVRGIYPTEIDEEGAYAVGRAFVEQFEPEKIAVGHDMRVTSPAMAEAVTNGAATAGANVLIYNADKMSLSMFNALPHLDQEGRRQLITYR